MKRQERFRFDVELAPGGMFDTLTVEVDHQKAGVNYFTGNRHGARTVVSFTPCKVVRKDGYAIRESVMLSGDKWESGFIVNIGDDARRNPKKLSRALDALSEHREAIAEAWSENNYGKITALLASIV